MQIELFQPWISEGDSRILDFELEFGQVLWCKRGFQSKIKKKADSFDLDKTVVSSGSTLFAQLSVLVCRAERDSIIYILCVMQTQRQKCHYENMPIQIYWKFTTKKWKFSD